MAGITIENAEVFNRGYGLHVTVNDESTTLENIVSDAIRAELGLPEKAAFDINSCNISMNITIKRQRIEVKTFQHEMGSLKVLADLLGCNNKKEENDGKE